MVNISSDWQNSLDRRLINRLTRPLYQPGTIRMSMSQGIINRCDRFLNRLPLLNQQMQRWGNTNAISSDHVPIVYAQVGARENREQSFQPLTSQNKPTVPIIQRKVDSAPALPVQLDSRRDFQNSNFLDEATSVSELPLVTPSATDSSSLNSAPRSPLNEVIDINQKATSNSELPLVAPSKVSEQSESTEKLSLKENLSDLQGTSADSSQLNINPLNADQQSHQRLGVSRSPLDEVIDINQKATSNSELPLVQESTRIPSQSLPIVQAKQQNSSLSRSSVPIIQPSDNLVAPQQNIQDNYSTVPLLVVSVASQINSSSQTRSMPLSLAKNNSTANNINQTPNLGNQNSIGSNTNTSSPPRIVTSSSPQTQTFVSSREPQTKIDLDAITNKVERKIMRRLVIESERRGKFR